jgi:hypothetical protein
LIHPPLPVINTLEVLDSHLPHIRDVRRIIILKAARRSLLAAETKLIAEVAADGHLTLSASPASPQTAEVMTWFYDSRLVGDSDEYLYLRSLAKHLCPLCGIAETHSLDHLLPKSIHPLLALTPFNLIAACFKCNQSKRATSTVNVNPYFDTWISDDVWLRAKVPNPAEPWALEFSCDPPATWSNTRRDAVKQLWKNCGLEDRFKSAAIVEIGNQSLAFRTRAAVGTVESELELSWASFNAKDRNGWKTAVYRAWLDSVSLVDWTSLP